MNIKEIINDNVNGMTFIGLDTITVPKLTGGASNPIQGFVTKHMTGANVMVFQNKSVNGYDAMVKRRLESEGKNPETFRLSPRSWGQRVEGTPFIRHNGNDYLEVIFLSSGSIHYELEGEVIDPRDIEGLNLNKPEGQQGGLNDKVVIRTFKVESISRVTINKQSHDLR